MTDDLDRSPFANMPNVQGAGQYNEAPGYVGQFRRVLCAQEAAGVFASLGWVETARVRGPTPRTWRITRAPFTLTTINGPVGNADVRWKPFWGAEVMGDVAGALGRVEWGDGQVEHVAEFDWKLGGSFTVHGSYVRVLASASPQSGVFNPAGAQLWTGATITPMHGAEPGGILTKTVHTGQIAEADFAVLRIPDYAKAVRWYQTQNTAAGDGHVPISLSVADDPPFTFGVRGATNTNNFESDLPIGALAGGAAYAAAGNWWWPLDQAARYLGVQNDSAEAATIGMWVEFLLDVG